MRLRTTVPVVLSALALVAAGCGEDEPEPAAGTATTEAEPTTPAETAPAEAAPSDAEAGAGGAAAGGQISTDLETRPTIPGPTGEPPSELEVNDVVEGKGPAAKEGDTLEVRYVGALFDTGEEFDASWNGGTQTFPVTLGEGGVIPGWEQGLVGMKAGGRRELVIPPDLAYGPAGQGPIPPDATLVFVVDLVEIS